MVRTLMCDNCTYWIQEGWKFCPKCGKQKIVNIMSPEYQEHIKTLTQESQS